jgi:hypothetical protein
VYGSLASVILLMFWLYLCSLMLIMGVINRRCPRQRPQSPPLRRRGEEDDDRRRLSEPKPKPCMTKNRCGHHPAAVFLIDIFVDGVVELLSSAGSPVATASAMQCSRWSFRMTRAVLFRAERTAASCTSTSEQSRPVLHHALDGLQMADGPGQPVDHGLALGVDVAVLAVAVLVLQMLAMSSPPAAVRGSGRCRRRGRGIE